jgi:hypothetical protein
MTDGVAAQRRYPFRIRGQVGAFIQRHANESKPRVRGQIRLGFGDDEPSQRRTCWVNTRMRVFYSHAVVL